MLAGKEVNGIPYLIDFLTLGNFAPEVILRGSLTDKNGFNKK